MRQVPDKVVECPRCKTPTIIVMRMSGNTIDSARWTDGKIDTLWPALIKCNECGSYFWRATAKVIGEIPLWGPEKENIPENWKAASPARAPTEDEYLEAIRTGTACTQEQVLNLRFEAWWAGNDSIRRIANIPAAQIQFERSPEARSNLETLRDLLDVENHNQRLMKAEAMRELGQFNEAIILLERDFPAFFQASAAMVKALAEKQDQFVREVPE